MKKQITILGLTFALSTALIAQESSVEFYDNTGTNVKASTGYKEDNGGRYFISTEGVERIKVIKDSMDVSGSVKANKYYGDGSGLTGIKVEGPTSTDVVNQLKADAAFISSVKGDKGDPGAPGQNSTPGPTTTDVVNQLKADAAFLNSVKGVKGDSGAKGDQGPEGPKGSFDPNANISMDSLHTKKGMQVSGSIYAQRYYNNPVYKDALLSLEASGTPYMTLRNGNTVKSSIDQNTAYFSQNVGIGTTTPGGKFDLVGVNSGHQFRFVDISTADNKPVFSFIDKSDYTHPATNFYIQDGDNDNDRLTFDFRGHNGANQIIAGTSSGFVGIGTTTPTTKLDIDGPIRVKQGKIPLGDHPGAIQIDNNAGGYSVIRFVEGNTQNATIHYFSKSYPTEAVYKGTLNLDGANGISLGNYNNPALFVRQTSDTAVGIGITNPLHKLHVNGQVKADNVTTTSDSRYKTNITPIDSSLLKILALKGVYYNWDIAKWPSKNFSDKKQIGLIAQEVEKIIPEVVTTDKEGYKSLSYDKLTAVLINALEDLKMESDSKIDLLKKENDSLKTEVKELKNDPLRSVVQKLEAENQLLKNSQASILNRLEALEKSKK